MTTIVSAIPVTETGGRDVEVITADPTGRYLREIRNGNISWYTWDGVTKTYMTTGWRALETLLKGG